MASIDITTQSGAVGNGDLQLQNGAPMDTTLRFVTDAVNTASPLKLSTTAVQVESPLRITTSDASGFYLDAEDSATNNRFSIKRDPSSQEVTLDFASNPSGSTTLVGAIRTYIDGVNLSAAMSFIEDGSVGVGTSAPNANALVDISSTTKGFLPPRMTNAQRAAISATNGLIVVNTTNNAIAYNDGTNWGYLSGALQTIAGSGGTVNIPYGSGNIADITLTASTTFTFGGHVVGTYIIKLTQGGSGGYTVTWPASVKWSGGTAPTLTTTVGKTDIVTLFHDGTNFYGTYSLNY